MGTARVKLVSINVELNRHNDSVASFLARERPDVICLQEVLESEMPHYGETLGMEGRFEPMALHQLPKFRGVAGLSETPFGLAIFSRYPAVFSVDYYCGSPNEIPKMRDPLEPINRMLLSAKCEVGGRSFVIGTTHFTWTPDGSVSEAQRRDLGGLIAALARHPEVVLCGDFNAPRGGEVWSELASRYKDNIPIAYDSSLDPVLHRTRGTRRLLVDGLFSTPAYRVSEARLVEGVSDHKAVVGAIE